ncbi:myosin regulatory light chain, smooth muscle-like isoform X1 [Ciona intestinalis]
MPSKKSFQLLDSSVYFSLQLTRQGTIKMAGGRKSKKEGGKKAQKSTSNAFSMFDQNKIQEFKEAFSIMDQNRDGFINKIDLKDTYAALGIRDISMDKLEAMVLEAPSAINFTVFLNMMADKLHGTDSEDVIVQAFKLLDPEQKGVIHKDYLSQLLMTQVDKFNKEEVEQMFEIAPIDVAGNLDYKALCYVITHGQEEE